MRAKITHGGVTVELEDATAEDVERVLSAIGDKRPAFEPIKELAPVPSMPMINPFVGDPLPRYPWPVKTAPWHDPFPYLPVTYCGDSAEVCS